VSFRFTDYIKSHQQVKISKRTAVNENESSRSLEKEKKNKQSYKNLEKTMSVNLMEVDLPISMKYRNYKNIDSKVTIGPSNIHRCGLFAIQE